MNQVGATRWVRSGVVGLVAFGGAFALTAVAVFVYAFRLALAARGAPDQGAIQAFARSVGPTWGPWLRILLACGLAAWVARSSRSVAVEGAVVGLVAGIAGLCLAWPPDTRGALFLLGTIGAALVGAFAGRRRPS